MKRAWPNRYARINEASETSFCASLRAYCTAPGGAATAVGSCPSYRVWIRSRVFSLMLAASRCAVASSATSSAIASPV